MNENTRDATVRKGEVKTVFAFRDDDFPGEIARSRVPVPEEVIPVSPSSR